MMYLLKTFISAFLIFTLGITNYLSPVFAEENGIIINSLDALPSSHEEKIFTQAITEPGVMTLLSEKRDFEQHLNSTTLTPELKFSPFSGLNSFLTESGSTFSVNTGGLDPDMPFLEKASGKKIQMHADGKKSKKVNGVRGNISVKVATGTIIQSANGRIIDSSLIDISDLSNTKTEKARSIYQGKIKQTGSKRKGTTQAQMEGFEFGLSGTHLLFSKPVMISIDTPNMTDGIVVDLLTLHEGDTSFNTSGLSVDPNTSCNSDGTASIPDSQVTVKNGKVTFYTCGASSFTMNTVGGTASSNDLKLIIGDCAQIQVYYKGNKNIYNSDPAATGCNTTTSAWPRLRVGTTNIGNGGTTAWTTQTTTGSQNGNTYTATTTLARAVGGRTYTVVINWSYTAPNAYFTMSYNVVLPAGNKQNVKFYYGMDTTVNGADANDVGYYNTGTQTVGIYDNAANQLLAIRYLSGLTWSGYEAGAYNTISSRITSGANFNKTITTTAGDLGFGVNWDFGTGTTGSYSGTVEWRMLPYVSSNVPDLVPSIGQPEPSFMVNQTSQLPFVITNAGNLASSGTTTLVFTVPTNFTGPTAGFTDNGWSCGAVAGSTVTCTKSGSIDPFGTDVVRIPVKPNAAAGGTTANFSVSITNASDSNTTNNTSTIGLQIAVLSQTQTLWLRADAGTSCNTNGCSVSSWADQSGLGRNATQGTVGNQPIYLNGMVNFNPVVNFDTTAKTMSGISSSGMTVFAVRNLSATTGYHTLFASPANTDFSIRSSSGFNGSSNLLYMNGPVAADWSNGTGTPPNFYVNGKQTAIGSTNYHIVRATASGVVNKTYSLSSTFSSRGMSGNDAIAEIMVYNTGVSVTQANQIESYLALKYGITLDQTTPTNYVYSNGSIIWSASIAGSYNRDIAGIGSDVTNSLSQKKSRSINNPSDVMIETGSILSDKMAFMWANNGAATGTITSVPAINGMNRISRAWKVEENNGDLGVLKISYPSSALPGSISIPKLITSSDGTFSGGTTNTYTGTLTGGNWEYLVNISDGTVFSFGQLGDITPPNITSISVASGTLAPSGNFSITVGYSDTGSSINAGSFTGKIYAWDMTGSTWSVTDLAPLYMSLSGTATSSTGNLTISNLPYGKYRFDISITDSSNNTNTTSYTYFVDDIEWTISSATYDIGNVANMAQTFGTGELLVTIRTVGAGFNLSMLRTQDLLYSTEVIPVYSGSTGWGYDLWNGSAFSNALTAHGTSQTLATVVKNINTNGQKNTYTYRLKYGMTPSAYTTAGDYIGKLQFDINLNY